MARVLLVPFSSPGHTVPFTALGARLAEDGHDVGMFVEPARAPDLTGITAIAPKRWNPSGGVPPELYACGDPAALLRFMFFGSVADMTRDVLDAAAGIQADLIVGDTFMPGAGLAGELSGITWATMSCCPIPSADAYRAFIDEQMAGNFDAATTRHELGLPAADGENLLARISPSLHIVLATPGFAGHPDLPAHVALVGPLVPIPPSPTDTATPTIVVTTTTNSAQSLGGRTYAQDRYLSIATSVLGEMSVQAVVTLPDGRSAADLGVRAANVRCVGPTAHDDLFRGASAVICHAGWGTVGRALAHGLPLVLIPIIGDQFHIARRCAELGVGVALDAATMSAQGMRSAIHEVCEQESYRSAARGIAAEIRAAAPLDACASRIGSLLVGAR